MPRLPRGDAIQIAWHVDIGDHQLDVLVIQYLAAAFRGLALMIAKPASLSTSIRKSRSLSSSSTTMMHGIKGSLSVILIEGTDPADVAARQLLQIPFVRTFCSLNQRSQRSTRCDLIGRWPGGRRACSRSGPATAKAVRQKWPAASGRHDERHPSAIHWPSPTQRWRYGSARRTVLAVKPLRQSRDTSSNRSGYSLRISHVNAANLDVTFRAPCLIDPRVDLSRVFPVLYGNRVINRSRSRDDRTSEAPMSTIQAPARTLRGVSLTCRAGPIKSCRRRAPCAW